MLEYSKNRTWFLFEGEVSCGNPSEIPHLWQFIGLAFSTTTSAGPFIGEIVQWSRHQVVFLGPKIMHPKRGGKHIWIQSIVAGGAEQKNSSVSCPYWVNFALNRFRRYALPHFLKPWTIFKCVGVVGKVSHFFLAGTHPIWMHHDNFTPTPRKFNSEFTPEEWWERKTILSLLFRGYVKLHECKQFSDYFQTANFAAEPCR